MSKILLLDIEMAPNVAHVWGIWDQNIGLNQLRESSYVMCYAAKWLGDKKMMFDSVKKSGDKKMLAGIHKLLDEADAVIHYNGKRFDIPSLNKEFLLHGMFPPAPFKEIDLLTVAKSRFRFVSNKLDYVAQSLGLGKKTEHSGHELWVQCMAGIPKAWKTMEEYNKNDVILLEKECIMIPTAWLIKEYDSKGTLVWQGLLMSEPTELSWMRDLKNKQHNLEIIPLIPDEKNIKRITNVKKYDSSKFVIGL